MEVCADIFSDNSSCVGSLEIEIVQQAPVNVRERRDVGSDYVYTGNSSNMSITTSPTIQDIKYNKTVIRVTAGAQ